jgi:Fuc2NAc and GlcNAc transferase
MVLLFSKSLLDFTCLASFLFPFYADELTTMAVRIKDRENLFSPHRRHIYQLLANEMGIPHWQVSIGYGLLQIIVGASVLMVMDKGLIAVFSLLLFFSLTFSIASWFIRSAAAESVKISLLQG